MIRLLLIVLILTVTVPAITQAQGICAPRNVIVKALKKNYSELQIGMGLLDSRTIIELWTSKTTGSWTIIKTSPTGWTCVIASGESWRTTIPDYATPTREGRVNNKDLYLWL